MTTYSPQELLDANRVWAEGKIARDADYFARLSESQNPRYLWIGCADSRVPANEIMDLPPGELFVHRNIANVVLPGDLNCLSVLQYAVDILKVDHIIVAGHYGCGGVIASMDNEAHGLIDHWLSHIRALYQHHFDELQTITDPDARADRMCELNVAAQVRHVAATPIVQSAWNRHQTLEVHGWIYRLKTGKLKNLNVSVNGTRQLHRVRRLEQAAF